MVAARKSSKTGFTLVEVLLSLALIALIMPVVARGLNMASLAGEVSQRKALAMRLAERVLNETIITSQWTQVGQAYNETVGNVTMRYVVRNDPWTALNNPITLQTINAVNTTYVNPNNLHLLTVDVSFPAQGQTFTVHLSTVVDITKQNTANTPPKQ